MLSRSTELDWGNQVMNSRRLVARNQSFPPRVMVTCSTIVAVDDELRWLTREVTTWRERKLALDAQVEGLELRLAQATRAAGKEGQGNG